MTSAVLSGRFCNVHVEANTCTINLLTRLWDCPPERLPLRLERVEGRPDVAVIYLLVLVLVLEARVLVPDYSLCRA